MLIIKNHISNNLVLSDKCPSATRTSIAPSRLGNFREMQLFHRKLYFIVQCICRKGARCQRISNLFLGLPSRQIVFFLNTARRIIIKNSPAIFIFFLIYYIGEYHVDCKNSHIQMIKIN